MANVKYLKKISRVDFYNVTQINTSNSPEGKETGLVIKYDFTCAILCLGIPNSYVN